MIPGFIQLAVALFLEGGGHLHGFGGFEGFENEALDLLFGRLAGGNEPLEVAIDCEAFQGGLFADARFEFGVEGADHNALCIVAGRMFGGEGRTTPSTADFCLRSVCVIRLR